jgi:hypothetical protein
VGTAHLFECELGMSPDSKCEAVGSAHPTSKAFKAQDRVRF